MDGQLAGLFVALGEQVKKGLSDIGKMPAIIGKENMVCRVKQCDLDSGGTNINAQRVVLRNHKSSRFLLA